MAEHDLGPLPVAHPREAVVTAAEKELCDFLADWTRRHDLTSAEFLSLVLGELSTSTCSMVRSERRQAAEKAEGGKRW